MTCQPPAAFGPFARYLRSIAAEAEIPLLLSGLATSNQCVGLRDARP